MERWVRRSASGPRRGRREAAAGRKRHHGPTFWEVAPGLALLCAVTVAPVLVVAWLSARFGTTGLALGLAGLAALAVPLAWWGGAASRRQGGVWSEDELLALEDGRLCAAVRTILRRDGWRVAQAPSGRGPLLLGLHPGSGIRIAVEFRLPGERAAAAGTPLPLPGGADGAGGGASGEIRVVVSRGEFSRTDFRWAARHDDVRLVGRHQLAAWSGGESLQDLLGLSGDRPGPPVSP